MEKLKNLADLAKQHYEKVLLVFVVLGLAVAVVLVYMYSVSQEQQAVQTVEQYRNRKSKSPAPLDIESYRGALAAARNPEPLSLSLPHRLLNPVRWVKSSDGKLMPDRSGKSVGPEALKIDAIRALNLSVRWVSSGPDGYVIEVAQEGSDRPEYRRPRLGTFKVDEKSFRLSGGSVRNPNLLVLKEVKGSQENPDALVFEISESKERFTLTKDKAYTKPETYVADLSYGPENRNFKNLRRESPLGFGGEEYKIVEITENEVVVSNRLNEKKTRLKRTP